MWLKYLFNKRIPSQKAAPASPAPNPQPEPPKPAPEPKESCPRPDFHDPVYHAMARLCGLGDIAAMWEMARWHRSHLRASTEQLLAAYEAGSDTSSQLRQRCQYTSPDEFQLKAYLTWVCQAARYGHPEAQRIAGNSYFFKTSGSLHAKTLQVGGIRSELHSSLDLNRLGMTDVDSEMYEFGVYPLTPEGVFMAYYLADYIPADSDGFGREDEYKDLFYDEFFIRLPARNMAGAEQLAAKNRQRREEYWSDPAHDPENRKYRQLWSEMPLEPEIVALWQRLKRAPLDPPVVCVSHPDYCDPVYHALVRLCCLGDITAMWELAHWHRKCLSPAAEQLLSGYEAGEDAYEALCAACPPDTQNGKSLDTWATWVCRAARYGHRQAKELIKNRELFHARNILSSEIYQVGAGLQIQASSRDLYHLGIPDAIQYYDGVDVSSLSGDGIFVFYYVSPYAGSSPTTLYFDEFFNLLPAKTREEAAALARKYHLRREEYWADPAHSPETRKYRCLLCDPGTSEE